MIKHKLRVSNFSATKQKQVGGKRDNEIKKRFNDCRRSPNWSCSHYGFQKLIRDERVWYLKYHSSNKAKKKPKFSGTGKLGF